MSERLKIVATPNGTSPLDNGEIRKIAVDVLNGLKYSFAVAAANPDTPLREGSVEESFRRAIKSRRPEAVARYQTRARALLAAPGAERQAKFGRHGRLAAAEYARLGFDGAEARLPRLEIVETKVAPMMRELKSRVVTEKEAERAAPELAGAAAGGVAAQRAGVKNFGMIVKRLKTVGLYITEVKCVDETDGFLGSEAGDDEIKMGGLAVDERGNVTKIGPFLVGSEFDGEKKTYSPHKKFCGFDLRATAELPKTFTAVVVLAEADWGGFAAGLAAAWQQAGPVIKDKVVKLVGSFGPWWQVLAEVVVWAVGEFINFLIDIFADDVFRAGTTYVTLHSGWASSSAWENGWTATGPFTFKTPTGAFTFKGHGGKYTVKCYWKAAP
jgi:hypothetical protein